MVRKALVFSALSLAILASVVSAQTPSGALKGRVTEASGRGGRCKRSGAGYR